MEIPRIIEGLKLESSEGLNAKEKIYESYQKDHLELSKNIKKTKNSTDLSVQSLSFSCVTRNSRTGWCIILVY